MDANKRQVGGTHYKGTALQHWDLSNMFRWDPFQYQITKYVMRWRDKNGVQDLEKAVHFLEKYIEDVKAGRMPTSKPWASEGDWPETVVASFMEHNRKFLLNCITVPVTVGFDHNHVIGKLQIRAEQVPAGMVLRFGRMGDDNGQIMEAGLVHEAPISDIMARVWEGPQTGKVTIPVSSVVPTGWKGYTYEGTKGRPGATSGGAIIHEDFYRCKTCKKHFAVPADTPPCNNHLCVVEEAEAEDLEIIQPTGRGYVDQDRSVAVAVPPAARDGLSTELGVDRGVGAGTGQDGRGGMPSESTAAPQPDAGATG